MTHPFGPLAIVAGIWLVFPASAEELVSREATLAYVCGFLGGLDSVNRDFGITSTEKDQCMRFRKAAIAMPGPNRALIEVYGQPK